MSPRSFFEQPDSSTSSQRGTEFDLRENFEVLWRRRRLIAICAFVGLVIGLVRYQMTPRLYRATSIIQIERTSATPNPSMQDPWPERSEWEFYPTQYRLLQSRGLAERVVRDLRLHEDPAFDPVSARQRASGTSGNTFANDELATAEMANELRKGLTVEDVDDTQLVSLSYDALDPEFAARVTNGYVEAFIDWGIDKRSNTVARGSQFLAAEIDTLKQEIRDKEMQLQAQTLNSDSLVFDTEGSSMVAEQLGSLNQSYSQAVRSRVEKEARYRELLQAPKETVADLESGGLVQQLRRDQLQLERDYTTRLKTYKPEWPAMVELRASIEKGQQHLDSVVEEMFDQARQGAYAEYQAALRQEQSLQQEMSRVRGEALDQSTESVEIANLRGEIQTRRDTLDGFYEAQGTAQATARFQETRESNVRIVDRALVPRQPYQPDLPKELTIGLAGGLVFGFVLVFLMNFLDRTLKSVEEVESLLGLPVLAVIADSSSRGGANTYESYGADAATRSVRRRMAGKVGRKAEADDAPDKNIEMMPDRNPRAAIAEAYRSLRAALLMSTADELRSVSLTSAESGEGKSSTATNLAIVMAQLGKRVLLIDADLRRPRLHQIFDISNRFGLVACLTSGQELTTATVSTKVTHLHLLPSGPIPPNPSELLASAKMRELIDLAEERYDMVIVDSPPVLAVSDPMHIGSITDGLVLCVAANSTPKDHCVSARDRLAMAGVRILGVVLNRYDLASTSYRRTNYYQYEQEPGRDRTADSAA